MVRTAKSTVDVPPSRGSKQATEWWHSSGAMDTVFTADRTLRDRLKHECRAIVQAVYTIPARDGDPGYPAWQLLVRVSEQQTVQRLLGLAPPERERE